MRLNKNTVNANIYLTLSERKTLSNPVFLFSLESQTTKLTTNFICVDISTATTRANKFTIIETGTSFVNLTASTVNLNEGWHDYKIYEQNSTTNLNPLQAGVLLQRGKCFVSGTTQQTYTADTTGISFFTYKSA